MKDIPNEVIDIGNGLRQEGFEAYLVGGCVRDLVLGREPKDWDIATNARPDDIVNIFPESVYENDFGTVGVKTGSEEDTLRIVEVTTYRVEGKYTNRRHPDELSFADNIKDDLSRRDFTVNALAIGIEDAIGENENVLIDPYKGEKDLNSSILRTVGDPNERFQEDALRLMRAARFSTELGFSIEKATEEAIIKNAELIKDIAPERIRDEFIKIILTPNATYGVRLLEDLGLLQYVIPELREGIDIAQNLHHIYTVFEHNVLALDYTAKQDYPLHIRMAALLHDVGKPRSKRGEGKYATFHGHEVIGAKMARTALQRLKFPKDFIEDVVHLVRYHMFYYNVGEVSEAGVRRFIRRVGIEYIDDLLKVREADRIGSGVPKAVPYKNRHLQFMIDKVRNDPISPKMLKIDGEAVMDITGIPPSRKVGNILVVLLEDVLDDPGLNTEEYLKKRTKELADMDEGELAKLAEKAKETKEEAEEEQEEEIKKKYKVK